MGHLARPASSVSSKPVKYPLRSTIEFCFTEARMPVPHPCAQEGLRSHGHGLRPRGTQDGESMLALEQRFTSPRFTQLSEDGG